MIEKLLDDPELRQIWFLDDGVLRGKVETIRKGFHLLRSKMAEIGLTVKAMKCEIIVTPTRASAADRIGPIHNTDEPDCSTEGTKAQCHAAGWFFQPFVADTYGALRSDARWCLVSRLITRYSAKFYPLTESEAGKSIWAAISGATMARVGLQLGRLHILDKPLGMPLNTLNLYTNRLGSSILPTLPANNQRSTGNVSQIQPSSMDMASDEEASIFPALHPQTQMETDDEPHQPRPPQSHAIEVKILHPDGSQLSLSLSTGLTCLQLKGVIHAHMPKMHPSTYTLTFQDFVLDDGLLISDVGISHGGVIQLHLLN